MTTASILPPLGLSRLVDGLIDAVRLGVRRFWRGGAYANAPAGEAVALLNRLTRILRFAFVILAVHVDLKPLRRRHATAKRSRRVMLRRPTFRLFPRYGIGYADTPRRPQPAAFAAPRDRILTAQRKLEALTRALADPMPPLVRAMARALPTRLMVLGWRPPKRPPPSHRRDFWDELIAGFTEARFALGEWRRRTRDNANHASGSERSGERKACADE